ncbi:MAG TPA: 4'-phosphopantetheinyl transferase superfamily protein [Bacilli bacterium]|nr:MAG: Holo-(acyl-carrier-protein) synthase [Tenericutes bacterium ADurb.BinA124]HNZ50447.1 4'-phosphopantetheinyl transferase superfamily protein [Bacilli bacterium]HPX84414.1 4'-phosphopantetheinyl transferase superfamily protein [Bacilli bacterium]HQC74471.1 4'-phosphopantetheinyl transferase superfamily protein [Bacilli bacterium]
MMNIGVDIVEIKRFSDIILNKNKYQKILSVQEIAIFEALASTRRQKEFIAGRFAAKEAIFKALNKFGITVTFPNVSIINGEAGGLSVLFSEPLPYQVLVSISHSEENAVAMALVLV